MNIIRYAVICLMSVVAMHGQPDYFPSRTDSTWARVSLEELGWDRSAVDSLVSYARTTLSNSVIVLVNGRIAIEWYAEDRTAASTWYWASAGKSVTAALVGAMVQEGKLSLSDPVSKYLGTGWTSLSKEQEDRITVWHQITMTSGLDDGVSDRDCTRPECLVYKADAGTRWAYHNAPYTILDRVIEAASGETFQAVLRRVLLEPTGMTGRFIAMGDNNVMWSNARSMARYGLLALRGFVWDGKPVLSDTAYGNAMIRPSQTLNPAYGYLWWLNGQASYKVPYFQINFPGPIMSDAPPDAFNALGKNNQIISVSPSMNIVMVRTGDNPDSLMPGQDVAWTQANTMWKILRSAMRPTSVPADERQTIISGNTVTAPDIIDRCTITSITGRQALVVGGNARTLDLPGLAPGVYMLRIEAGGRTVNRTWMCGYTTIR